MRPAPAVLGGRPRFPAVIPVARPTITVDDSLLADVREVLESGILTAGPRLAAFERAIAEYLGVTDVVAVSSCTTGLLLTLRALAPNGSVVLPSFTFMATGNAVLWNGLTPVFADADPLRYTLDPAAAGSVMSDNTAALLAVHTFGAACDADPLANTARAAGIPLIFDAAHAFGARYPDGTMVGSKGMAEIFSLSPTKTLPVGEGGLVATSSPELAADLRVAREYGNAGDYDAKFAGLNGRLSEINATIGLAGLSGIASILERKAMLVDAYRARLSELPGLRFQTVPSGARSAYKDFTIAVDPERFGLTRDQLAVALRAEGVDSRAYFDPPMHRQTAYRRFARTAVLPHTEQLSATLLSLPLYAHLDPRVLAGICDAIEMIHECRERVLCSLVPRGA